jgi:hypothetical protein
MTINGHWQLFDYLDSHGRNVMQGWAMGLGDERRARLDLRIEVLERSGDSLPPKLITPTSGKPKYRNILEMRVNGPVALRPMLCRGPFAMRSEFTFLFGAEERDRKYVPLYAPKQADKNRLVLLKIGEHGRENHKRFSR